MSQYCPLEHVQFINNLRYFVQVTANLRQHSFYITMRWISWLKRDRSRIQADSTSKWHMWIVEPWSRIIPEPQPWRSHTTIHFKIYYRVCLRHHQAHLRHDGVYRGEGCCQIAPTHSLVCRKTNIGEMSTGTMKAETFAAWSPFLWITRNSCGQAYPSTVQTRPQHPLSHPTEPPPNHRRLVNYWAARYQDPSTAGEPPEREMTPGARHG